MTVLILTVYQGRDRIDVVRILYPDVLSSEMASLLDRMAGYSHYRVSSSEASTRVLY